MFNKSLVLILIVGTCCLGLFAQSVPSETLAVKTTKVEAVEQLKNETVEEAKKSVDEIMLEQIKRLEARVQLMQAELDALKKSVNSAEKFEANKGSVAQTAKSNVTIEDKADTSVNEPNVAAKTTEKGDLSFDAGDYKIIPYGIIFFNAFGNSGGTNNADDPLWATPGGQSNASASGRQTRFGVKITGGRIGNANVTGVVEADFYGGFPAVGVGENMGVLRLRVAKAQFDWERTSLTVGQDWILFAPNNPTSLAAAAIPQFAAAGNLWSRLPQVRVEQKIGNNFKWQGAVLAPGTGDFPTGGNPALLQPGTGAASRVPFFQSRISYSNANWFDSKKSGSIGLAGHYGRSEVNVGNISNDVDSIGVALDWSFPIIKRVTLAGEAFFGRNLGGFQGGIFQGYNTDFAYQQNSTLVGDGVHGVRGIGTRGGWTQIGWILPTLEDRLTAFASVGLDDPNNEDLFNTAERNFRTRNFGYAFDLIYKFSPKISVGIEFRRLETLYLFGPERASNHINLGGTYSF
jgi:hypothetical protein